MEFITFDNMSLLFVIFSVYQYNEIVLRAWLYSLDVSTMKCRFYEHGYNHRILVLYDVRKFSNASQTLISKH